METRVLFATDVHGSDAVFEQFCDAADSPLKPDVLIIGGDIMGKDVEPVMVRDGKYYTRLGSMTEGAYRNFERQLAERGKYAHVCSSEEEYRVATMRGDVSFEAFQKASSDRLIRWMEVMDRKFKGSGRRVIVNAGNDDYPYTDDILKQSEVVQFPEGKVLELDEAGLQMLSCGWSNKTPFNTARECSEEELAAKIAAMTGQVHDMGKCIFNLHVPPYKTKIDVAAGAGHVGSTTVRDSILQHKPALGLHGHIHEAPGTGWVGETPCTNPGSQYEWGKMSAAYAVFKDGVLDPEQLFITDGKKMKQQVKDPWRRWFRSMWAKVRGK